MILRAPTWTAGADVLVAHGAHIALAPSFRLRWIRRLSPDLTISGIGSVSVHVGAAVLFR
jgi:hypothetical protein